MGFSSPDVPAYFCYFLIVLFGAGVAIRTINTRLRSGAENRWAFAATWALFFAYTGLPILLFWFLDYTDVIHDTSLFAAVIVGVGYQEIFAGGIQAITMPGQTAALWKPFAAWVEEVSARISSRNLLYIDQFAEKVKSSLAKNPSDVAAFEGIVFSYTKDAARLQAAIMPNILNTGHADADVRRKIDVLWVDFKLNQPDLYGWILLKKRLVGPVRYWLWLKKGRAWAISLLAIVLMLASLASLLLWIADEPSSPDLPQSSSSLASPLLLFANTPSSHDRAHLPALRYYIWRFLKANTTDRDRWRSREYLTHELCDWGNEKVPVLADAVARANQAAANKLEAQQMANRLRIGTTERVQADAAVAKMESALKQADDLKQRAIAGSMVLPRLLAELRYPEIQNAKAGEIMALLVNCHSPALNAMYVPDLIESLRTQNEVVRLETRKILVALNIDYPGVGIEDYLEKWEPKKSETGADIDQRVRQWRSWWKKAQAVQLRPPG